MATDIRYQVLLKKQPDPELTADLSEIRIRESVDQATECSVKFAVDICKTDYSFLNDERLQPGDDHLLTILVIVNGEATVLAHGLIVKRDVDLQEGGPGSSFEVQVRDRRVLMDRNSANFQRYSGRVDGIVQQILGQYGFELDVDIKNPTDYQRNNKTLNQTGSDLALLKQLAGQQDCQFWLSWQLERKGSSLIPGASSGFDIIEKANFKPSPPGGRKGPAGLGPKLLASPGATVLSLNAGDGKSTLLGFKANRDQESPNKSGRILRVDIDNRKIQRSRIDKPDVNPLGEPPLAPPLESVVMSAGNIDEAQRRQNAALNDASWTIKASAESSAHALCGRLVRPHQIVSVTGAGQGDDGDYFVFSVEHQITPADHRMSLDLRRNAVGRGASGGLLRKVGGF